MCLRGGYGCLRVLDEINFDKLKQEKVNKPIIGFSDITILQLAVYSRLGLVSIHAPMLGPWFKEKEALTKDEQTSAKKMWQLLQSPKGDFSYSSTKDNFQSKILNKGKAEGVLLGGNLTSIASMIDSGYLPDCTGAILFLEDVDEDAYRIDRYMHMLHNAKILANLSGLVLCDFKHSKQEESSKTEITIKDLLKKFDVKVPAVYGFPVGHGELNFTVPIGKKSRLEANEGEIILSSI